MLVSAFHLSAIVLNSFILWYDQVHLNIPLPPDLKRKVEDLPFKGHFLFLTIWCMVLQTTYFMVSLLNDILGTNARAPKHTPFIRTLKDTLFSLAFPTAFFVATAFWGIYFVNKEVILPDYIEKNFPTWLNHGLHTTIVPFILIELVLTNRNYPSRKVGISLGLTFILAYLTLLGVCYLKEGSLVYPVLDVMPWYYTVSFLVSSAIWGMVLYFLGEYLDYLVKGSDKSGRKSKKR